MIRVGGEFGLGALGVVWLGGIVAGFAAWERYDATPGAIPRQPVVEHHSSGPWTLVMFVHPRCPCAHASLGELQVLRSEMPADVEVRILFVRPAGACEGWEQDSLWAAATQLPGVRVECDPCGEEAQRVGATTSGHVILRGAAGATAFQGGITRARGRAGDNPGRRAIAAILRGDLSADRVAPVFGCPLFTRSACPEEETGPCPR